MTHPLLLPPVAFAIYLVLVGMLAGIGRYLAGAPHPEPLEAMTYASGEAAPAGAAIPGYQPFFVVALFFAVVHLGVLMLGTSALAPLAAVYLLGLLFALVVLLLG